MKVKNPNKITEELFFSKDKAGKAFCKLLALLTLLTATSCGQPNKSFSEEMNQSFGAGNFYQAVELDLRPTTEDIGASVALYGYLVLQDRIAVLVNVSSGFSYSETDENSKNIESNTDTQPIPRAWLLLYDFTGNLLEEINLAPLQSSEYMPFIWLMDNPYNELMLLTLDLAQLETTPDYSDLAFGLYHYSMDGSKILAKNDLVLSSPIEENSLPSSVLIDRNQNLYLGNEKYLKVYDPEGKQLLDFREEKDLRTLSCSQSDIYALWGNPADNYGLEQTRVDLDTHSMRDLKKLNNIPKSNDVRLSEKQIFFSNRAGFHVYNEERDVSETLFLWVNTDLPADSDGYSLPEQINENTIIIEDRLSSGGLLYLLQRQSENPNNSKIELRIGGVGISYDPLLQEAIYQFNKSNKKYKMVLEDYISYGKDMEMRSSRLETEILAGAGSDIFIGTYEWFQPYFDKDYLVDLAPLVEKDENIQNKNLYLPQAFTAGQREEKLYTMTPSFTLSGIAGSEAIIGKRFSWNLEEFNQIAQSLPENMQMFPNVLPSSLFAAWLSSSINSFLSADGSSLDFSLPLFEDLLQQSKMYGSQNQAVDMSNYNDLVVEEIRNKEIATYINATIYGPDSYVQLQNLFRENISFVGMPLQEQSYAQWIPDNMMGINKNSKHKDVAWSFISTLMGEDLQMRRSLGDIYNIPVLRQAFESQIAVAKKVGGGRARTILFSQLPDEFVPLSAEAEVTYRQLIEVLPLSPSFDYDESVYTIIAEEAAPYFAGEKNAEEIKKVIKDRLETYLSEKNGLDRLN